VIKVRDLERSTRFYSEVMGLQIMKMERGFKMGFFVSDGRDHHEIAAMEVGLTRRCRPRVPSVYRTSLFGCATRRTCVLPSGFARDGVKITTAVNHRVTKSVYFEAPDGDQLEIYCDGLPEEVAKFPDPYAGMEKLDFAPGVPDFREAAKQLTR
jgi:catechol 2,3-dioxygenase